jgi:esterase/lipase
MEDLLLLHGAIGSEDQIMPLANVLKENFAIHTINFSGHANTLMPETFSIELFANDILFYLEQNKIKKINIFGYSMGGYVALYLAKHHPERINKIFTLATKFLWTPEIAAKETRMLDSCKILEKVPAFASVLEQRHLPNDWKIVLKKTSDMMIEMGNNSPLRSFDYTAIENPVLIGIGDNDIMVTLEETINVYQQLKNGNLIVFPQTQHPIEKMDVGKLSNEIRSYFK